MHALNVALTCGGGKACSCSRGYFEKPSNISTNPQVRKPDPTMAPMINSIALPPTLPRSSSSAFADSITPFPNSD